MANNVGEWSATAASNTSLGAVSLQENIMLVNAVNNAFREAMAQVASARTDGTLANLIDEDSFATDSATRPPSQQSVKAYVTAAVGSGVGANDALFALEIADLKGDRLGMVGGIADPFDDETDVDTATSANEVYSAGSDLYSPSTTATRIAGGTPSTLFNGTAADFNDNNSGTTFSANNLGDLGAATVANRRLATIDYGSNRTITQIDAKQYAQSTGSTTNNQFYTSTDGTSWSSFGTAFAGGTSAADITKTGSAVARYIALVVEATGYGALAVSFDDFNGYEDLPNNMTLVSNAFTAAVEPDTGRLAVQVVENESITINTDLTMELSRDGGTTWTAGTLALISDPVGSYKIYEDSSVDISAQPSGTSMKWRVKTLNNKDIDASGVVLQWS